MLPYWNGANNLPSRFCTGIDVLANYRVATEFSPLFHKSNLYVEHRDITSQETRAIANIRLCIYSDQGLMWVAGALVVQQWPPCAQVGHIIYWVSPLRNSHTTGEKHAYVVDQQKSWVISPTSCFFFPLPFLEFTAPFPAVLRFIFTWVRLLLWTCQT